MKFYSIKWRFSDTLPHHTDYYPTPELAKKEFDNMARWFEETPAGETSLVEIDTNDYPLFAKHNGRDDGGYGSVGVYGIYPTIIEAISSAQMFDYIEPIQWGQPIEGDIQIILW